ncbi:hypothetical protein EON63_22975 [archaeon]|nr:MAG: hypothetical protein EON63_22975 [archaeon]
MYIQNLGFFIHPYSYPYSSTHPFRQPSLHPPSSARGIDGGADAHEGYDAAELGHLHTHTHTHTQTQIHVKFHMCSVYGYGYDDSCIMCYDLKYCMCMSIVYFVYAKCWFVHVYVYI